MTAARKRYTKEEEEMRCENANSIEGSMRQQQTKALLAKLESDRKVQKHFSRTMQDGRLAHRRRMLVELGVVEQSNASQLITDPDESFPTDLERIKQKAFEERQALRVAQKQHKNEEKAKQVYLNRSLLDMEREMSEHSKRVEWIKDAVERAVLHRSTATNCAYSTRATELSEYKKL